MKKNTHKKILAIALILMIVTILPNIVKAENTTSTTTKTTNNSGSCDRLCRKHSAKESRNQLL